VAIGLTRYQRPVGRFSRPLSFQQNYLNYDIIFKPFDSSYDLKYEVVNTKYWCTAVLTFDY